MSQHETYCCGEHDEADNSCMEREGGCDPRCRTPHNGLRYDCDPCPNPICLGHDNYAPQCTDLCDVPYCTGHTMQPSDDSADSMILMCEIPDHAEWCREVFNRSCPGDGKCVWENEYFRLEIDLNDGEQSLVVGYEVGREMGNDSSAIRDMIASLGTAATILEGNENLVNERAQLVGAG